MVYYNINGAKCQKKTLMFKNVKTHKHFFKKCNAILSRKNEIHRLKKHVLHRSASCVYQNIFCLIQNPSKIALLILYIYIKILKNKQKTIPTEIAKYEKSLL